jgi:FMN phosphatase YigB (HAD superfamily)
MIKFVLFDFANTLVYKPDVFKVFQSFIQDNYNHELSLEYVKAVHDKVRESIVFPDKTSEEFYLGFNEMVLKELDVNDVSTSDLKKLFTQLRELKWKAFSDSTVLKDFLLPKAVLSNWDECLELYVKELTPYDFEFAMGSFTTGVSKPDTKFYQAALDKIREFHNFNAENILMVGDSPNLDIEPALKIGMKAVLIDRERQFKNYPGIIIDSLHKLSNLINKLNEPAI